jgi:hypothetical protein
MRVLALAAIILLTFAAPALPADDPPVAEQVIGTWTQVSSTTVRSDGSRTALFGPGAKGLLVLDRSGHFSLIQVRGDLPRFASGNRASGNNSENRAVVRGSLAIFGTYTVNAQEGTITLHIEGSTFPNWSGTEQKRTFTVAQDELKWQTPAATGRGETVQTVWRRLR